MNWIKRLLLKFKPLPQSWNINEERVDEKDAWFDDVFGSAEFAGATRDWRKHAPKHEVQRWGDCVSFSRNNCAEIMSVEDGDEFNFSDLYSDYCHII